MVAVVTDGKKISVGLSINLKPFKNSRNVSEERDADGMGYVFTLWHMNGFPFFKGRPLWPV